MFIIYIIKGLLIGFLASIPVGPIAVLCIQRTLSKGWRHGFSTGAGAAFSDMVYALLAAFGMSIVVTFMTNNQYLIQVIGSIVIFGFGIYLFQSKPLPTKTAGSGKTQDYVQDFLSAFFMTITNPMMIALFIGLFARFHFIHEDISFLKTIFGILLVFLGAALWWFLLVSFVNLFRSKINVRSFGIVNKVAGGIIILLAILGFVLTMRGNSIL
ncbi:MAG: LysE family transporter [Prevotellaceae bacterium]|jgi:threonine/homoserine/homoserine lactone efflux protein|nr:LysE family transporter [Prevotellaceae bacterium]